MKGLFSNRIALWAASLAAIVVGWFVHVGILTPEQTAEAVAQLTGAFNGVLLALLGVAAIILNWVIRKFSGGNASEGEKKSGSSGGTFPSILITTAAVCLAGLALPSCSNLTISPDRCVTSEVQRNGMTYRAGACFDLAGKIDRVKVEWTDSAGREGRAYIYKDGRPAVVQYKTEAGLWLTWSEGGGVTFEQLPPEVIAALENQAPLPAVKAVK